MELNNYDRTSGFYDALSRLVFFKAQVHAQTDQLKYIPAHSRILIVGGGTGWILEEICKVHPGGLEIVFVEISGKMLLKAMKRKVGKNKVSFIHAPIETFEAGQQFDVILTAFLFDNFSVPRINQVFFRLNELLKPGGLWLFSDFSYHGQKRKIWQRILLKIMYFFFRTLSNVEAEELTDMVPYFYADGYKIIDREYYYRDFITSIICQKPAKIPTFI